MSALILCACVSVIAAALTNAARADYRRAVRDLELMRLDEVLYEAAVKAAIDLEEAPAGVRSRAELGVQGRSVKLRLESEAAKWPISTAPAKLTDRILRSRAANVSLSEVQAGLASASPVRHAGRVPDLAPTDCLRSLVSPFGRASFDDATAPDQAQIDGNARKDGEIWRIVAESGARRRELYVRFVGDPSRVFSVISDERQSGAGEATCVE